MEQEISQFNIPSPSPIYAQSYRKLSFKINDNSVDLTAVNDILFSIAPIGDYSEDLVLKFKSSDIFNGQNRIIVDKNDNKLMHVFLYSSDTINFVYNWYVFQIMLIDVDIHKSAVIGQGKIRVFTSI